MSRNKPTAVPSAGEQHPMQEKALNATAEGLNPVLIWADDEALPGIPTSAYWNDEAIEKAKAYYVLEGEPKKLWTYLRESTTYYDEYQAVLRTVRSLRLSLRGTGVDAAAGVCWTTALLSQLPEVDLVYAIEISKHRLFKLAPVVCRMLGGIPSKIVRVLGSFYRLDLTDHSADFCLLSQAFHHADAPRQLLGELHRVLKPGGVVAVIGETPISSATLFKKRIKNIVKMVAPSSWYAAKPIYKLIPSCQELFPADRETGDHYYRLSDYRAMFREHGFLLHERRETRYTVFVAVKK